MIKIILPGGVGVEETIRFEQAVPHKIINHKLVGVYAAYSSTECLNVFPFNFFISLAFHLRKNFHFVSLVHYKFAPNLHNFAIILFLKDLS